MPSFFLSSAAGDDDPYVREVFADLRHAVSGSSDDRSTTLSFLDIASSRHPAWPAEPARKLSTCDVFVALCSPRYFRNDVCGRQWWVFNERLRARSAGNSPLIAVAWTTDADPPPFVDLMTPRHDGAERGLRQLVRLRSLRDSYTQFIGELAGRITAAVPPPVAEPVLDVGATRNAFDSSTSDSRVHFVVAAASRAEMDEIRDDVRYYGPVPEDWAPYLPAAPQPIATRARSLAAEHALGAELASMDDVVDRIELARRNNEIVVVLVDAWLTQLDAYQRVLADIDRRGLGATAVLVPANRVDAETMANRDELRFGLRNAFRLTADRPDAMLRTEIGTADSFDSDLAGVLEEARNRLFRVGRVSRSLPVETPSSRPLLRGP